jgi:hypothetical protein
MENPRPFVVGGFLVFGQKVDMFVRHSTQAVIHILS